MMHSVLGRNIVFLDVRDMVSKLFFYKINNNNNNNKGVDAAPLTAGWLTLATLIQKVQLCRL